MSYINNKPFSQACENNKVPILSVIGPLLAASNGVLEIGSGTGQHAVYFAGQLPHLIWYTSDRKDNHAGLLQWQQDAGLINLRPPVTLDVCQEDWPDLEVDAVFTANTAHIMHWHEVEALFKGVAALLPQGGLFILYGPVNYNRRYTSESNARFDAILKDRDPESGIRDFGDLNLLAADGGMSLKDDFAMPANNRIICWVKHQVSHKG